MKTNKKKIWIGCGILCVLSVFLSSWNGVAYNDSRLVVPMDFKDYVLKLPTPIGVLNLEKSIL